jgi:SAM-dependent methyltransferase
VSRRPPGRPLSTADDEYSLLREAHESVWWKRLLPVQAPYRWHLRRLRLGFTLDLGCGNGRSLRHLGGNAVGVDHNRRAVEMAKAAGFEAFTPEAFRASHHPRASRFDSLLLSHVAEHMVETEAVALVGAYLPMLRPAGRVVFLCPQEAGYRTDPTHVQFMDFPALRRMAAALDLAVEREYSHPFPREVGRWLRYNEFVSICRKPTA